MSEVQPIKPGIMPEIDAEREMLSYVAETLRKYHDEHGAPPMAIAFVLVGPDLAEATTSAYSFAPADTQSSSLHTCSVAAAVLWKRALGMD